MLEAGIHDGDIVVSIAASSRSHGRVVVCAINGETSLKLYETKPHLRLAFANRNMPPFRSTRWRISRLGRGYLDLAQTAYGLRPMDRVFALIDGNSFYCSCERVFDAKLAKRPVLVLSTMTVWQSRARRRSKPSGIQMGDPFFKIRDLCRREKMSPSSVQITPFTAT